MTTSTSRSAAPARVARRAWPALVGLTVGVLALATVDPWEAGGPMTIGLPLLAVAYLLFAAFRGELRRPDVRRVQLAGLAGYGALALIAVLAAPEVGRWIVAGGWFAHALWDLAHHRSGRAVPRWYAEFCIVADILIGVSVLLAPVGQTL